MKMRLEAIKGVAGGTLRNGTCLGQTSPRQGWTCGNQTLEPRGRERRPSPGPDPQTQPQRAPGHRGQGTPQVGEPFGSRLKMPPQTPQSTRREADPQHSGCCAGDQVCRPLTAHQHTLRRGGPSPKSSASATNLQGALEGPQSARTTEVHPDLRVFVGSDGSFQCRLVGALAGAGSPWPRKGRRCRHKAWPLPTRAQGPERVTVCPWGGHLHTAQNKSQNQ